MMAPSTLLPCTIRVAVSAGATLRCRWASRLPTVALGAVRRFGLASCAAEPRRVCVVGSGPAGMYATSALLNASPDVQVDVIERLCTPFGLIRFGVAPDHPEMKVMADKFDVVAADERVRLIGNVEVGRDVSVAQLQRFYDGLIFAFGADGDRTIGLDGEHETDGVHAARDFVAWYNGLPSHRDLDFKLDEVDSVVVVGNGNVATDVARILLMPTTMLARTDIAAHALDALERSTVNKVTIVGRRGPAQAAWTGKELREILNTLPDVVVDIRSDELAMTESPADKAEMKAARVKKRCVGMLKKKLEEAAESHAADADSADATKVLSLRFCLSPAELHTIDHQVESSRLSGVSFTQMSLQGEAGKQRAVTVEGAELEQMDAQLLLRSVGYRSVEMDGLPWNDSWGVVPTDEKGRIVDRAGMYATGWVRRGPSGVISTNKSDAEQVVDTMMADFEAGISVRSNVDAADQSGHDHLDLVHWLSTGAETSRSAPIVCDYDCWRRIDTAERAAARPQAPREKLVDPELLLSTALGR